MKKELLFATTLALATLPALAGPHGGSRGGNGGCNRGGNGGSHGGRAPSMHVGGGSHGGRAPSMHVGGGYRPMGGGHHMPMRGGHYGPRPYYWDRNYYRDYWYDYAPVVIGGGIVGATIATQPVVVQQPVVAQPTVITSQPVQTPQTIWVEGRYVDQVQPDGSIIRTWQPGHYEQVQIQNVYQ